MVKTRIAFASIAALSVAIGIHSCENQLSINKDDFIKLPTKNESVDRKMDAIKGEHNAFQVRNQRGYADSLWKGNVSDWMIDLDINNMYHDDFYFHQDAKEHYDQAVDYMKRYYSGQWSTKEWTEKNNIVTYDRFHFVTYFQGEEVAHYMKVGGFGSAAYDHVWISSKYFVPVLVP